MSLIELYLNKKETFLECIGNETLDRLGIIKNDKNLTPEKNTLIHLLVQQNDIDTLKTVLQYISGLQQHTDKYAIVNFRNNSGDTALHLAVQLGNQDAANLLCEYGANPKIPNNKREIVQVDEHNVESGIPENVCGNEGLIDNIIDEILCPIKAETRTTNSLVFSVLKSLYSSIYPDTSSGNDVTPKVMSGGAQSKHDDTVKKSIKSLGFSKVEIDIIKESLEKYVDSKFPRKSANDKKLLVSTYAERDIPEMDSTVLKQTIHESIANKKFRQGLL